MIFIHVYTEVYNVEKLPKHKNISEETFWTTTKLSALVIKLIFTSVCTFDTFINKKAEMFHGLFLYFALSVIDVYYAILVGVGVTLKVKGVAASVD